jgi:hypothetical protein
MSKASVEEMKRLCEYLVSRRTDESCSIPNFARCDLCWFGKEYCRPRARRYELAKAILEDKVIWHEGELCLVEEG